MHPGRGYSVPEPGLTRRQLLVAAGAGAAWLTLPRPARAEGFALPGPVRDALGSSRLVYVSPLRRDGSESRCHGEVWFVADGSDAVIVTAADRWKAVALGRGLDRARLWFGDFGVWTRSGDKFRSAPGFEARASRVVDPALRERALGAFGRKYADEWDKWGPRFRAGLADGSRVMIRYAPAGT
jgi:hypothetical protein